MHDAVMETSPARAPFSDIEASGFLITSQETHIAETAAAAAERFVVTAM